VPNVLRRRRSGLRRKRSDLRRKRSDLRQRQSILLRRRRSGLRRRRRNPRLVLKIRKREPRRHGRLRNGAVRHAIQSLGPANQKAVRPQRMKPPSRLPTKTLSPRLTKMLSLRLTKAPSLKLTKALSLLLNRKRQLQSLRREAILRRSLQRKAMSKRIIIADRAVVWLTISA